MNLAEIRRLVKLVEDSKISELEIEEDSLRIRIIKQSEKTNSVAQDAILLPAVQGPQLPVLASPSALAVTPPAVELNISEVTTPMVGTFYRAPTPESPPYVQVGDHVRPGQVICIVEAMKLMNEIEAEVSGRITEVLVENAQPVEFGQAMFKIELD